MHARYKVMCGCEYCISAKSIHLSLLSWRDIYLRKLNNLSQNSQNRRSGENSNLLFETYKHSVIPHGRHLYATAAAMVMAKMCENPPYQHSFTHWKCLFCCCYNLPRIDIPYQESDRHHSNASPSIHFYIYHLIARCNVHGRRPLDEKKICRLCFQDPANVTLAKLYIRKERVMMETSISDFHTSFYIRSIKISHFTFHRYKF